MTRLLITGLGTHSGSPFALVSATAQHLIGEQYSCDGAVFLDLPTGLGDWKVGYSATGILGFVLLLFRSRSILDAMGRRRRLHRAVVHGT